MKALSTDGEATVYLTNNFAGDFDLSYDVRFPASPGNHSWTVVNILLWGGNTTSGSVSVGLSRGAPNEQTLSGFIDVGKPRQSPVYRTLPVWCRSACDVELRGDAESISAFIDHRMVGSWSRKTLAIAKPSVQINGEVSALGDRVSALLTPIRVEVAGKSLASATCAFTTQGVHAYSVGDGGLRFTGQRDAHADATFVSLVDGSTGERCPHARKDEHQ